MLVLFSLNTTTVSFIFLPFEIGLVTAVMLNNDKLCHGIVVKTNTFWGEKKSEIFTCVLKFEETKGNTL